MICFPLNQSSHETDATIWFGHYPTSTIVSGLPGVREVLGRGLVYLCGHLHNMHGLAGRLYARHKVRTRRGQYCYLFLIIPLSCLCTVYCQQKGSPGDTQLFVIVSRVNIDLMCPVNRTDYGRPSSQIGRTTDTSD